MMELATSNPPRRPPNPHLHHLQCGKPISQPDPLIQTTLCNDAGLLAISKQSSHIYPPPFIQISRTPAPSGLRTLHRKDRESLPTKFEFAKLPAEIRIQIYRLLLITSESGIRYCICISCKRMMLDRRHIHHDRDSDEDGDGGCNDPMTGEVERKMAWQNHWIYPAILGCSKLTYHEGMPILYGENAFALTYANTHMDSYHTWQISPAAIALLKRARLGVDEEDMNRLIDLHTEFVAIKELDVHTCVDFQDWQGLLSIGKLVIGCYDKVTFLRAVEFDPVWEESRKKWKYQTFDSSFDNLPGRAGICYTKETQLGDVGAYRRLDYIPPFPLDDEDPEPTPFPSLFPRFGQNGVLRVIISTSDTESCPLLQEDACAQEIPFDGKPLEDDDLLIHYVWEGRM